MNTGLVERGGIAGLGGGPIGTMVDRGGIAGGVSSVIGIPVGRAGLSGANFNGDFGPPM